MKKKEEQALFDKVENEAGAGKYLDAVYAALSALLNQTGHKQVAKAMREVKVADEKFSVETKEHVTILKTMNETINKELKGRTRDDPEVPDVVRRMLLRFEESKEKFRLKRQIFWESREQQILKCMDAVAHTVTRALRLEQPGEGLLSDSIMFPPKPARLPSPPKTAAPRISTAKPTSPVSFLDRLGSPMEERHRSERELVFL